MIDPWPKRFATIRTLGWFALAGTMTLIIAAAVHNESFFATFLVVVGVLLILPGFFYTYIVVIWHWKARYRGSHSDLWGAIMFLENSGWSKLVYLFRHLLPDMRRTGRYRFD